MVVWPAAERADIFVELQTRKIVGRFDGREPVYFDGSRVSVGLPTQGFFFELLQTTQRVKVYNLTKRLKGLTPYEFICTEWRIILV